MSSNLPKNVLLTGGAGFLGHHLVRHLADAGCRVRSLDLSHAGREFPDDVEIMEGSILDEKILKAAMDGMDAVIHMAAEARLWVRDEARYEEANHRGTQAVFAAAQGAGVGTFIHCSTEVILRGWRDSRVKLITPETLPDEAEMPGPYTRSKWRAERFIRLQQENSAGQMRIMAVYPTVPLGPGDRAPTAPTRMVRDMLAGRTPAYLEALLNFVDARDVAAGFVAALQCGDHGGRYILGGENLTLSAFLKRLAAESGRPMPRRSISYRLAAVSAPFMELVAKLSGHPPSAGCEGVRLARNPKWVDTAPARHQLGWQGGSIDTALSDMVREFCTGGLDSGR